MGHAVPGAPQRAASGHFFHSTREFRSRITPGTDMQDDRMQDVLKTLSQMTRKLASQLGEEFVGSTAVFFAWSEL